MTTITYTKDQVEQVLNKLTTALTGIELIRNNVDYRLDGTTDRVGQAVTGIADIMRAGKASDGTLPLLDKVAA